MHQNLISFIQIFFVYSYLLSYPKIVTLYVFVIYIQVIIDAAPGKKMHRRHFHHPQLPCSCIEVWCTATCTTLSIQWRHIYFCCKIEAGLFSYQRLHHVLLSFWLVLKNQNFNSSLLLQYSVNDRFRLDLKWLILCEISFSHMWVLKRFRFFKETWLQNAQIFKSWI